MRTDVSDISKTNLSSPYTHNTLSKAVQTVAVIKLVEDVGRLRHRSEIIIA